MTVRANGHADHCTCSECGSLPSAQPQRIVFSPLVAHLAPLTPREEEVMRTRFGGDRMLDRVRSGHMAPDGVWHDVGVECECPGVSTEDDDVTAELKLGTGTELKDLALAFAMRIEDMVADGGELLLQVLKPGTGEIVAECNNAGPLLGRALALALRLLGRP